jgi:hypothetical protein
MAKHRVTVLATKDSTEFLVDKVVETKNSARSVIKRFLRLYPDCYEVNVESAHGCRYSSHQEYDPLLSPFT